MKLFIDCTNLGTNAFVKCTKLLVRSKWYSVFPRNFSACHFRSKPLKSLSEYSIFWYKHDFLIIILAKEKKIFAKLTKAAESNGHFKVYNRKNIPARWHVNNPKRMGPILALADVGYAFQDLRDSAEYHKKEFNISSMWTLILDSKKKFQLWKYCKI